MSLGAIFLTTFNRPELLERVLDSWSKVTELQEWHWVIRIEPSPYTEQNIQLATQFFETNNLINGQIIVNEKVLGVLHHPWVAFEELFETYEFVIRAEDDLCVSNDILKYFRWAFETYTERADVATVNAYTDADGDSSEDIILLQEFNPWVWGTWKNIWTEVLSPTWDHDYSTFNGIPGNQSGWDWNINTRIFPEKNLLGVHPAMSRVDNIGIWGVHGNPQNHRTSKSFREFMGTPEYRET